MTGLVEVASLALAVLPIVISVSEHYSSAALAVQRYRHFSAEIHRFSTLVRTQRTIFRGEIQSLLSTCIGWEQAELLLQDIHDKKWEDTGLEESVSRRLGNTRELFLELVACINGELSGMEARLSAFEEVAELAKKVGSVSLRACDFVNLRSISGRHQK
jgi:hypothetical protein